MVIAVGTTRHVVVEPGALASLPALLSSCFGSDVAVLIADERTFEAAGEAVDSALRASGSSTAVSIVLPGTPPPYADIETVALVERQLRERPGVPVVVGSGTLNDVMKVVAHRLGRAYACVATAASMDGYTAFGAAITVGGFKRTLPCPPPLVLVADLDVLTRAPAALTAAGYGDLLGKVTAGADWIVADELGVEPIDARAWALVQDHLRSWIALPDAVAAAHPDAVEALFEGLVQTGIAMQVSASSRPASGSEHLFSHLWEMQALATGATTFAHGHKVAVGTLASAALYERLLERDLSRIDVDRSVAAWPDRIDVERRVRGLHSQARIADHAVTETLDKYVDPSRLRRRLERLRERWPALRERLVAQLLPAATVRTMLEHVGCPTEPSAIGLDGGAFRTDHIRAHTIRSRYTMLDLAVEAGVLDACVAEVFGPRGFWYGHAPLAPRDRS